MLVVLDGGLIILLVLFVLVGLRRGPWPEVVTLGGLLLGALLADEWGEAWGGDLAGMAGFLGPSGARMVVRGLLLLVPLIAVGYGGALLLPKGGRMRVPARLSGALLGLLNGSAILALLLRDWHISQGVAGSPLTGDPITNAFLEWAGWWGILLGAGGVIAVLAAAARRSRAPRQPATLTVTPPITGSSLPAPDGRGPSGGAASVGAGSYTGAYPVVSGPAPGQSTPMPSATYSAAGAPATPQAQPSGSAGKRCRTCGEPLAPGAAFCTNCGTPV